MKKYFLITFIGLCAATSMKAQTTDTLSDTIIVPKNWKFSGTASVTMTQSSYTNWASGGENSVAGVAGGGLVLDYEKNKWSWHNTLDMAYGLLLQGSKRSKTDDRIEVASKLGYKAFKYWNYAALAQLKTQFDNGYDKYPVEDNKAYSSKFFAPAYLTLSLGMDYNPCPDFSLFISPITMRTTFVNDKRLSDFGSYGVNPGDKSITEYGAFIKATYRKMLMERIMFKSKLELFSNWADKPQNIDLSWEVNIDFKVTKWFSTKLYTQMIYDDDIRILDMDAGGFKGPRLQFKEVLGVGLSYIF